MSEQNNMDATFGQLKQQWMDTKDQAKVDEIVTQLKVLAEKGHGPANALLGKIFDSPRNKKRDEIAALDYLEQAVKLKVPEAFSDLGLAYQNRNELEKAAALFKEGAELGDASSMGSLGDLLIAGEGVAKDSINGIRWLKKAADAGDNYAKKVYAFQLIIGEAITADPAKAIEILESEFKEQREGAVAYNIARAYSKLNGDSNKNKMNEWLKIAADLGHEDAKTKLGNDKRNAEWSELENFSYTNNGKNESYHFFYKSGTVVNKETKTQSSTYTTGVGENKSVQTRHTSWQEISLKDSEEYKFTVSPDTPLTINSGTEVDVIYAGKGGEDEGFPVFMIESGGGKKYEIRDKTAERVRNSYVQTGTSFTEKIISLLAWVIIFIAGFIASFPDGSDLIFAVPITLLYFKFKAYKDRSNTKAAGEAALAAHLDKIATYFQKR